MASNTEQNIKDGAAPFLAAGEAVQAVLIASVRGHQQAMAGGIAGMVGGSRHGNARNLAEASGIRLTSPMSLVLTSDRLLTLKLGSRGRTEELLNEFSLVDVGPMNVKRLGLGASVTLSLCGVEVKLESRVGAARAFGEELQRLKNN